MGSGLATVTVWAATSVSANGKERTCAPRTAQVLAANKFGAVYRERRDDDRGLDDLGLTSCTRDAKTSYQSFVFGAPQLAALDIAGRFFAYPESGERDDAPQGITNIFTNSLLGRGQPAFTILASAPPVSVLVDVTKLQMAPNQAMVWIVCQDANGFGRLLRECVRDGRRRWIFARPASGNYDSAFVPRLIATGRHIDARYLRLSAAGRTVTWRQQGRLKRRDIGP